VRDVLRTASGVVALTLWLRAVTHKRRWGAYDAATAIALGYAAHRLLRTNRCQATTNGTSPPVFTWRARSVY
jgi:hypothetical protein